MPEKAQDRVDPKRTTISCSTAFAEAITSLARDAGLNVMDFCDERVLPKFSKQYADLLRSKLAAVEA